MALLNSEHDAANQDRANMGDDMDSLQRLFDETVRSHRHEQEQLYLTIQVLQNRIAELENKPTEEVDNNKVNRRRRRRSRIRAEFLPWLVTQPDPNP